MKKYIVLCFLCFCLPELSHAQIYLKAYTGYALSTGNDKMTSLEIINNDRYESSYTLKFGQGLNLGFSAGYLLNKNVAFEITCNTQVSSKYSYSKPYQPKGEFYYWRVSGFFGDLEYSNTMFQLSPQVIFMSGSYSQWNFYLKGGPDFMWSKHERTIQTISMHIPIDNIYQPSYLYINQFTGSISTGIQVSFGTEYKLSKNVRVFAELTAVNARYIFTKNRILRYEEDGQNALSKLETTSFKGLNNKVIFNHAGLNIGLKYIFQSEVPD